MSAVEALDTMDARIPWQDPETGHGEPRQTSVWRVACGQKTPEHNNERV